MKYVICVTIISFALAVALFVCNEFIPAIAASMNTILDIIVIITHRKEIWEEINDY